MREGAMTPLDLDRMERIALAHTGKDISTACTIMPGELLELVRLARVGRAAELKPPEETL
jgi:hypothetical protein